MVFIFALDHSIPIDLITSDDRGVVWDPNPHLNHILGPIGLGWNAINDLTEVMSLDIVGQIKAVIIRAVRCMISLVSCDNTSKGDEWFLVIPSDGIILELLDGIIDNSLWGWMGGDIFQL